MLLIWRLAKNNEAIGFLEDPEEIGKFNVFSQQPIGDTLAPIRIRLKSSSKVPDYFCCSYFDIVSLKIKSVIESVAASSVEFIPVTVKTHEGELLEEFFYMRVLLEMDCFDREKSDFTVGRRVKRIISIRKLVLKPVEAPQNTIVRITGLSHIILAVGAGFAELMRQSECTGVSFVKSEDAFL